MDDYQEPFWGVFPTYPGQFTKKSPGRLAASSAASPGQQLLLRHNPQDLLYSPRICEPR
jgi:hypothetical protein